MRVLRHKIWFDLWQRRARTLLAVFSIAVGVFAVGTIFGMVDQLLSGMNAAHRATNPSHLNIFLRQPVDRATAEDLARLPGIAGVEVANQATVRYRTAPDAPWESAALVMRDSYTAQRYDTLQLIEGAWPTRTGFGIERLTSSEFGIDVGDEVIFELAGSDRAFPITGRIRHPFVPPPDFGGQAYFFADAAGLARFGIPEGRYLQLLVQVAPYSEQNARDGAAAIRERLAGQGIGVAVVLYQKPDVHWGNDLVSGINLVLQILAVVSLLASVILVVNTTTATITQQTDQIGIMKALGARRATIAAVYLSGVAFYGVLALAVSLPLGTLAAFLATRTLLNLFNIDYETLRVSTPALLLQSTGALAAPLLAALWPVVAGTRITVREALATYGLGADFGRGRLDRLVESVGARFLAVPAAIALGNLFRRKGRLWLTQGVLVAAGATFMLVLTLSSSLTLTVDNELARRRYDLRLNFFQLERSDQLAQLVGAVAGVAEVEGWYSVAATLLREGEALADAGGLGAELYAVPAGSTMYRPLIVAGRWLEAADTGRVAVISQDAARFNDLAVGDTLTVDLAELGRADFSVIGIYQAIAPDAFATDPLYAPAVAVVDITNKFNRATQLLVRATAADDASVTALMGTLIDLLEERQINVNTFFSRSRAADRAVAFNQFGVVINLLLGLAALMGVVGGVGLAGSLSISVVERTREIGVLRAIGATGPRITRLFVMEGILQGVLSWLIATPLALLAARPVAARLGQILVQTELDFAFNWWGVALWLLLVLAIACAAAILPARGAARISVRESLAYA